MINKEIMTKEECIQDIKELLIRKPHNRYRLFKYGKSWHYIDNDYYTKGYLTPIKNKKGNIRKEFTDIENQKNIIIIYKGMLGDLNYGNRNK